MFVPSPPAPPVPQAASTVTFAALGNVTANADGTPSINKIDMTNTKIGPAARRPLRLVINAGGSVRMCDPSLAVSDTRGCPAFP